MSDEIMKCTYNKWGFDAMRTRMLFYFSTVFHAMMPLLLLCSFWFPFYFDFIMCSWLCGVWWILCTADCKLWVPFELQLYFALFFYFCLFFCMYKFIWDYFHLNPPFFVFRYNFNDIFFYSSILQFPHNSYSILLIFFSSYRKK